MKVNRSSGILLHITSLPGDFGIGTLGEEAKECADRIKRAGFKYWQLLPIGPVSNVFGFSPYSSPSTFAGNPLFISLSALSKEHWFSGHLDTALFPQKNFVYYNEVMEYFQPTMAQAYLDFMKYALRLERVLFQTFCKEHERWLDDYSLFTALSEYFNTTFWPKWEQSIAMREPEALIQWKKTLHERIEYHKFVQFIFFTQWRAFKKYVNGLGIELIGDIPIYITMESAEAWSHPEILQLDSKTCLPIAVSGVPPDYFSKTGQRWGNPLYRWYDASGELESRTISWWIERISHLARLVDIIRIDHFRGFEAYWAIPYEEKTAVNGEWVKGPGSAFFRGLHDSLGDLPLIAEDLGVITPEVETLRDSFGFPGMRILQFAFDFNNKNTYLPHNIDNHNCILYSGTHDNNTTNGWFYGDEINDETRRYVMEYIGCTSFDAFHWHFIRLAYQSVANCVIIPAQDILGFGKEFRMNTPGTTKGNWGWKLIKHSITDEIIERLRRMGQIYRRLPEEKEEKTGTTNGHK